MGRIALLILLFCGQVFGQKVLVSDRALFRVDKQVFFEEGFSQWVKEWRRLECVTKRSMLLRALDVEENLFKDLPNYLQASQSRTLTPSEKLSIDKTVKLVKLMLFVQTQASGTKAVLPETFSCIGKTKSPNIDAFLQTEAFLRSKFKSSDRKRMRDDISRAKTFIDSVSRATAHEIYL
ncbi:MAG: hypothetical protein CME71_07795 [Halobacteriovorax sp.]|nr:hypothetical protein [Halobacteriovorax sp.]